jgi:DNA-binding CsgD family transcriptional regulator/PAS domain-containing protein
MQPTAENEPDQSKEIKLPKEYMDLVEAWQTTAYGQVAVNFEGYFRDNPVLNKLLSCSPCVTMVLDLRTQQFSFISSNAATVFGYGRSHFLANGLSFCNRIVHPEDLHNSWKLLKCIWDYILAIPSERQAQYKFNYDYRIVKPDGKEVRILAQSSVMQSDSKGNITHVLGVYSDISHWKKSGQQTASVVSTAHDTCSFFSIENNESINPQGCLSRRELEIVKLMAEGYSSKLIAEKLFISFHTVNTHRQKIIEKTNTRNTGALVQFAVSHDLI